MFLDIDYTSKQWNTDDADLADLPGFAH